MNEMTTRAGKTAYLTFDDGPDASITPQIALFLHERGVKATFFLTGFSPPDYRRIYQVCKANHQGVKDRVSLAAWDGKSVVELLAKTDHAIGNHGWVHDAHWYKQSDRGRTQVEAVNQALQEILPGQNLPKLLRAPIGWFSPEGPIEGYEDWYYYHWTVYPEGIMFHTFTEPQEIIDRLVSELQKKGLPDNPIILLHSIRSVTLDVLTLPQYDLLGLLGRLGYTCFEVLPRPADHVGYPVIESGFQKPAYLDSMLADININKSPHMQPFVEYLSLWRQTLENS